MKVYLVGVVNFDWQTTKHVCLSEETARARWEELRQECLKEAYRMVVHAWNESSGRDGWYDSRWADFANAIRKLQFGDSADTGVMDCPFVEVREVES
jgi:hypothetical protein